MDDSNKKYFQYLISQVWMNKSKLMKIFKIDIPINKLLQHRKAPNNTLLHFLLPFWDRDSQF